MRSHSRYCDCCLTLQVRDPGVRYRSPPSRGRNNSWTEGPQDANHPNHRILLSTHLGENATRVKSHLHGNSSPRRASNWLATRGRRRVASERRVCRLQRIRQTHSTACRVFLLQLQYLRGTSDHGSEKVRASPHVCCLTCSWRSGFFSCVCQMLHCARNVEGSARLRHIGNVHTESARPCQMHAQEWAVTSVFSLVESGG